MVIHEPFSLDHDTRTAHQIEMIILITELAAVVSGQELA
jgi:hypothetical protein